MIDGSIEGAPAWFGPAVAAAVGPAVAAAMGPAVADAMGPAVAAAIGPTVAAAVAVALGPLQNTSARGCNSSVMGIAGRRLTPLVDVQVGGWLVGSRFQLLTEQCS